MTVVLFTARHLLPLLKHVKAEATCLTQNILNTHHIGLITEFHTIHITLPVLRTLVREYQP